MPNTPFISRTNLHVLIADDDVDDVWFLKETLHDVIKAFKTTVLINGEKLMGFLQDETPDIIFLNINMASGTGLTCIGQIRGLHKLRNIPVIIFSSVGNQATVQYTQELGANLYFEKPSNYVGMKNGLTTILSHSAHTLLSEVPVHAYLLRA